MTEDELRSLVRRHIETATGAAGGELSIDRSTLMDLYLGEPLGTEIDGRSQVVSQDVMESIETVLPDLIQVFTAGDDVVRYEPENEEDEEPAQIATQYINWVWMRDNPGFCVFHDWFKDALIQVNGVVKIYWDESERQEKRRLIGLTDDEVALVLDDKDVKVIERSVYWREELAEALADYEPDDEEALANVPPEMVSMARVHDLFIERTRNKDRARVINIAPEDFLISARSLTIEDANFCADRTRPTASDLIEMGYDRETVDNLPSDDENKWNAERISRFTREEEYPFNETQGEDPSMREITTHDCYVRVDFDGDGKAELRYVKTAGSGYHILENEEVDEAPYAALTPYRMPHKFFGRSLSELVDDLAKIKTAIWRQALDNMYGTNSNRLAISSKVDLEDVLDVRHGAPIRVEVNDGTVGGHVVPIQTPSISQYALPLLEYADTVREMRTGVSRLSQGLDPDALESTASGINMLLGKAQNRVLMIAKVFAETGVKDAFGKLLRLVVLHQKDPRSIPIARLTNKPNKFLTVDPRPWNAHMDVDIAVGIGHGTREQQVVAHHTLLGLQEKIVAYQGGVNGPLVSLEHIHHTFTKLVQALGFKSASPFIADIGKGTQTPPQPNPEIEKMKAEMELKKAEFQMRQQEAAASVQQEQQKAQGDLQIEREKMELARQKSMAEIEIMRLKAQVEIAIAREKHGMEMQIKQTQAAADAGLKRATTESNIENQRMAAEAKREEATTSKKDD